MAFGKMKGQGATEYLVLLAVVLIIALVVISILSFFPGIAGDARITQSDSFWRGEARPIAITESMQQASSSTIQLVVANQEGSARTLTAMKMDGNGTLAGAPIALSGGESKAVNVTGIAVCGVSGAYYEYTVVITYDSEQMSGAKQTGTKTLIGKCS